MRYRSHWFIILLAFVLTACGSDEDKGFPDPFRIAVLPDQETNQLIERYTPLTEYLSAELGVQVVLKVPQSYQNLLDLFHDKEIDFAYFGGVTFVQANLIDGAKPLVMRDIDAKFTSYFIVRADETANQIADMRGRRLSFGSRLSTSGHLMPRQYLNDSGIVPEDYFDDVAYSGAHDLTAMMVRDGLADIGAVNSVVIDAMFKDGRLRSDEVRILWESPPYADYVWALRSDFSEASENRLRDSFLALSRQSPTDSAILDRLGARMFLPASAHDFVQLQTLYSQLSEAHAK
jgi:phosphonate transport system substrate-binding protein